VVIGAVTGTAGIGKTALAVRWAHRVRGHFPDGQLYLNLRGYASSSPLRPIDALSQFLRALGVAADQVPVELDAAAALYRSLVADRRMLVLLDNARSPEQVRPLLPGTAGCLVLVTSRDDLAGLVARDGARRVLVDVLPEADAEDLLRQLIGADRAAAEPEAIAELARLCGHLPLALRIAGANLSGRPHLTVAAYAARLRDGNRLAALTVDGDDKSAVRAAFDLSYAALPEPARRLFRLLGLVPGPDVTSGTAAALADAPVAHVADLLDQLARAHLVEEHAPGRYTFHDLLRLYAADRGSTEDLWADRDASRRRLFDHYQQAVGEAADLLYTALLRMSATPGPPSLFRTPIEASQWLDAERVNLLTMIVHTAAHGPRPVAYHLADGLRGYFYLRMRAVDWLTAASTALDAARAEGDLRGESAAELSLATLYGRLGRADDSIAHMRRALALSRRCGWVESEATLVGNLGAMCAERGLHTEAIEHTTKALAILRATDATHLRQYIYVGNLGSFYAELGDLARSDDYHCSAVALAGDLVSHIGLPGSLYSNQAQTAYLRGDLRRALDLLDRALALHRESAAPAGEAEALWLQACVRLELGALAEAAALARQALPLARDAGRHRVEAHSLATLGRIHQAIGEPEVAGDYLAAALRVAVDLGLRYVEAVVRVAAAARQLELGRAGPATVEADAALNLAQANGYRIVEGQALAIHAAVALAGGRPDQAIDLAASAVAIQRATGHRLGEAQALVIAGRARQATGGPAAAEPDWRAALAIYDEVGARAPADLRALLQSGPREPIPVLTRRALARPSGSAPPEAAPLESARADLTMRRPDHAPT
jgi:tetratricopeptide (TPR) repeat protein